MKSYMALFQLIILTSFITHKIVEACFGGGGSGGASKIFFNRNKKLFNSNNKKF